MTGFILMDSPDASNIQQLASISSKYGASGMDDPSTRSDLRLRLGIACDYVHRYSKIDPEISVNAELSFVQIGRYLTKVTLEL